MPTALNATVIAPAKLLTGTVNVAARAPRTEGVIRTSIEQVPPGATTCPLQLSVTIVKSPEALPLNEAAVG